MNRNKNGILYLICGIIIFGWWSLAFSQKRENKISLAKTKLQTKEHPTFESLPFSLPPFQKEDLRKALLGDARLMTLLIAEWDTEAKILKAHGVKGIERLPEKEFLKTQIIGRKLQTKDTKQLNKANRLFQVQAITDDNGQVLTLNKHLNKFLPQTYISASFLFSLVSPKQIVAIPKGIRKHKNLFCEKKLNDVVYDIDRQNSEVLYRCHPDLAFVANYSNPSTLKAFQNQGIQLFSINNLDSIQAIEHALLRVGHIVNNPLKADLLERFMNAAMMAMDNRIKALYTHCNSLISVKSSKKLRILYLTHSNHFSLPSDKTITNDLLKRLHVNQFIPTIYTQEKGSSWQIPLNKEEIIQLDPDFLIISSYNPKKTKQEILEDPALHLLKAIKNHQFTVIDSTVQNFPSQLIVLAYFDLYQSLTKAILGYASHE